MKSWILGAAAALALAGGAQAAGYHVIDRIAGPDGGWDYLRVDARHNQLLIPRGTAVMAIDLATRQLKTGLAPGGRQHIALPLEGGREMLVTNGATDTAVFADPVSGAVIATVPTAKGPDAAAVEPKSGLILVMGHAGGEVTLIDPKTHKLAGTIEVGGALEAAVTDGAGKAYVNVEDKNEIVALDLTKKSVLGHWPLAGCDGPTGLAYDAADKLLMAACDGSTVFVDARSGKVVQTLATGKGADGIAFDPRQKLAFVPSGREGTLAVIAVSPGKSTVVQTVPTQVSARTIAIDERSGRVYLPSAEYGPATPGARPSLLPGTFRLIVVGK